MKFSHSLQFNAVPEWSSKYIAYSNLKKLIYNLQRESLLGSRNIGGDSEASYLISRDQVHHERDVSKVFLAALDAELQKIDKFFQEKEASTIEDYNLLLIDVADFQREALVAKSNEVSVNRRHKSIPTTLGGNQTSIIGAEEEDEDEDSGEEQDQEQDHQGLVGGGISDIDENVKPFRPQTRPRRSFSLELDNRSRRNSDLIRARSPEFWDNDFDDLKYPFSVLGDIRITLKKRTIALYTQLSELKSFIELNRTGFTKALKKFDKSLNTKLKDDYLQNLKHTYVFNPTTEEALKQKLDELTVLYASIATNGAIETAKSELRLHLREHVVWERNTVWKDMIGLERKAQAASVARKQNSKEIVVGEESEIKKSYFNMNALKLSIIGSLTLILLKFSPFHEVEQKNCFAILISSSLLWATEAIPLFVTSLLVPLLIVVLGVLKDDDGGRLDPEDASKFILGAMWSSVIMLLLGGFTLAAALSKYNIAKVISTWILSKAGTNPKVILFTVMVVALFVSMWVSNVAAPVLCYSIIQSILRTLPRDSSFGKQLVIGIALASNVGGMASPIASPQNIISIGLMDPQPSWGVWFAVAIPICVISLVLIWLYLLVLYRSNEQITLAGIRTVDDKFSKTQWFVSITTIVTIVLWCLAHQLSGIFGELGVISIIPMLLFFGTGVLNAEDFNNFLWTIVILAMGGIALGKGVSSSGLLATIAEGIQARVQDFSLFSIMLTFGALILVVATFVSHTVAALIIVPLVAEIGSSLKDPHPNLLVMVSALLCSCAMGLPTSGFPNVTAISLVDDFGNRYLTVGNFIVAGVPCSIFAYLVVVTVGYLLMRIIGF